MNPFFKTVARLAMPVLFLLGGLVLAGELTGASRIEIISPMPGQKIIAGQRLTFRAKVDPVSQPRDAMLMAPLDSGFQPIKFRGPPYEATILIPNDWAGHQELFFVVKDSSGKMVGARSIALQIHNPGRPLRLEVITGAADFDLDWSVPHQQQITVMAYFDGDRHRTLKRDEPDIRYRSLDASIATVDASGLIKAKAPGLTLVEVEFRGVRTWIPVDVHQGRKPTPPVDLAARLKFHAGDIRSVSAYGNYAQTVTVTNISDTPLRSPLFLVLSGLPEGIRLENKCKTRSISPPGNHCVRLARNDARSHLLLPGESLSVRLEFFNWHKVPIRYVPHFYLARFP